MLAYIVVPNLKTQEERKHELTCIIRRIKFDLPLNRNDWHYVSRQAAELPGLPQIPELVDVGDLC